VSGNREPWGRWRRRDFARHCCGWELALVTLSTRNYSQAINEFVRDAIHGIMLSSSKSYSSLRRKTLPEGVISAKVAVEEGVIESPAELFRGESEVHRSDIVAGSLDAFHAIIASIATEHAEIFDKRFVQLLEDSANSVGNSASWSADELDWGKIVDGYEQVDWAVDSFGQVQMPIIMAGEAVQKRLHSLGNPPAEALVRLALIAHRKQEEYVSRRRSRRIR
jgi:hypothetical protein